MTSLYMQLRTIYRDLDQRRSDLFYEKKRKEKELQEIEIELKQLDISLADYQQEIENIEEIEGTKGATE